MTPVALTGQTSSRAVAGHVTGDAAAGVALIPVFERRLRPALRDLAVVGECARCLLTGKPSSSLVDIDLTNGEERRRVGHLPQMGTASFAADGSGVGSRRTGAVGHGQTFLVFFDPAGRVTAESSVPDATSGIAAGTDHWFVGSRDGGLIAFARDGRRCWQWDTPGAHGTYTSPYTRPCPYCVMAHPSGVVVASFADIYAIDTDGRTLWHAELPNAQPFRWRIGEPLGEREHDKACKTLGLSPGADGAAIKAAFRRRAMATHPDRRADDPESASRFAEVRKAYECLQCDDRSRPHGAPSGTLTVEFGFDPTVTFLTTGPGDTVLVGSSDGRVCHVDDTGRLDEVQVLGDGQVRAARRADGTLGVAARGDTLLFAKDNRVVHSASLIREPRRMTMCGEDLVWWNGNEIELIDTSGHVRWSAAFSKPLRHVVSQGDTLACVAGALTVFRRPCARRLDRDHPLSDTWPNPRTSAALGGAATRGA